MLCNPYHNLRKTSFQHSFKYNKVFLHHRFENTVQLQIVFIMMKWQTMLPDDIFKRAHIYIVNEMRSNTLPWVITHLILQLDKKKCLLYTTSEYIKWDMIPARLGLHLLYLDEYLDALATLIGPFCRKQHFSQTELIV